MSPRFQLSVRPLALTRDRGWPYVGRAAEDTPSIGRSCALRSSSARRRDLDDYLNFYDYERPHTGRLTRGRISAEIVYGASKVKAR